MKKFLDLSTTHAINSMLDTIQALELWHVERYGVEGDFMGFLVEVYDCHNCDACQAIQSLKNVLNSLHREE